MLDVVGNEVSKFSAIIGDGVADDTNALEQLIQNNRELHIPKGLTIRITRPITININTLKLFDGGNSTFIIDGIDDFVFHICGTMVPGMSANPSTLTDQIISDESNFIIKNCKFKSTNMESGGGLLVEGCFQTHIENNYFFQLKNGIKITGTNRNLIISNNNIYQIYNIGILIDNTVSLHQFNLVNNHISYCAKCVVFDNLNNLANFQCVGNDIEISTYPENDQQNQRCLVISSDDIKTGQVSEIEIVGNTIQGHALSNLLIDLSGGLARKIQHLSVCDNHISNINSGCCVKISNVNVLAFNGNTLKDVSNAYCAEVLDSTNISVVGNAFDRAYKFIHIADTQNMVVGNNVGETSDTPVDVEQSVSGLCMTSNVFNGQITN